jgi:hypothetical protein
VLLVACGALVGLPTAAGCVLGYGALWKGANRMPPRLAVLLAWTCGAVSLAAIAGVAAG